MPCTMVLNRENVMRSKPLGKNNQLRLLRIKPETEASLQTASSSNLLNETLS